MACQRFAWTVALFALTACGSTDSVPAAASASDTLHVTVIGRNDDPRLATVREALGHWNATAAGLGLRVRFDSGTLNGHSLPESALQATGRAMPARALGVLRLRSALADVPGDVVIALSQADFISFGVTMGTGRAGVVGLRDAGRPPLSLPNVMRNVVAHELGHILGLEHNADSTTLMCGRPATCRPNAFASDSAHFFPLTTIDEQALQKRWR